MFFSTKAGPIRIQIVNSISTESKKIRTISNETSMSYYHVKYNVKLLEDNGFIIKINSKHVISKKFKENYEILTSITNQKMDEKICHL